MNIESPNIETATIKSTTGIGSYLIYALKRAGIDHIFGVPGDYILAFYGLLAKSDIQLVGTTREDTAAFAADGYARNRGIGALAVTYGVGALNTVNAIAGAYAESSPVVIISGAPGVKEQRDDPLLHHRFGPFTYQREIFQRITAEAVVLDDPVIAFRQIDRALKIAREKSRPVYLELPRDRVLSEGMILPEAEYDSVTSDPEALAEAISETLQRLQQATKPVIVAGVELHRRGLMGLLKQLVKNTGLPIAATLTGKSVFSERHPQYLGIYEGAMSSLAARDYVEQADLILMLGLTLNDVDTGIYSARLDPNLMVRASKGEVLISHHRYANIALADFVTTLASKTQRYLAEFPALENKPVLPDFPQKNTKIRIVRLIERLNQTLSPALSVVCDTGDCLFASIELHMPEYSNFYASAFYTSMGFAVPAALGTQLSDPEQRALILVGDGAFQMTGTELSTHARFGLAPIVIVFNNHGYSTERFIMDGPFNDISEWRFDKLGQVFGSIEGYNVFTEEEFDNALKLSLANTKQISLLNVHLKADDPSPAMRRLGIHLGNLVNAEKHA
jgi:indolepyruvate decarboxylase